VLSFSDYHCCTIQPAIEGELDDECFSPSLKLAAGERKSRRDGEGRLDEVAE
jgi:hypothetical protein